MSTKFKSTLATLSTLNPLKSLGCSWMLSEQPGTNMVFPDAVIGLVHPGTRLRYHQLRHESGLGIVHTEL